MTSIEELNPTIKGIGRYEFGWADKNDVGANATAASTRMSCATSPRSRANPSGCSTCA